MRKILTWGCLGVMLVFLVTGCGSRQEFKRTGFYLGSVFEVSIKVKNNKEVHKEAEKLMDKIFGQLIEMDTNTNKLSPISEISAINANAGLRRIEISANTYDLVKKSILGSILTDGFFDITWQPLIKLFESEQQVTMAKIDKAKSLVGYLNIQLDKSLTRIHLDGPGIELDFDHIKRGYAIDLIISDLIKSGLVKSGYVKAGNIAYYLGSKKEVLKYKNGSQVKVKLKNRGIATVSREDDYYANSEFWKRYLPVEVNNDDVLAVTVIAPNATTAEVLANAFYFMGVEKSLKKVSDLKGEVKKSDLYNVIFLVKKAEKEEIVSSLR